MDNIDNIDNFIKDIVSRDLKPHESFDSTIYSTFEVLERKVNRKTKIHHLKFDLAIACCFIFLITGVVFAKEIENFVKAQFENFGLGRGFDTAIDNGYIAKPEMDDMSQNVQIIENNEVIDSTNVKVKIDEFLMTDSNLSLDFYFEFENKICDYVSLGEMINENVDYEGSHAIVLSDLFIVDENNEVLYFNRWDCENFKEYCKNNNMDFDYPDYNLFGIRNMTREYNKNENFIEVNNIYYLTDKFPNSKKLNIYFTKIDLINDEERLVEKNLKNITLKGNWQFSLDVPENMYNRTYDTYKVVSCDNKDFNLYEAKLTDTRLEIGIEISNVEMPIFPAELEKEKAFSTREEVVEFYGGEEYANLFEEYLRNEFLFDDIVNYFYPWMDYKNEGSYAINSNGEKFKIMIGGFDSNSYKDDKKFDCRCTCDITKYDDYTDKITLVIYFKDQPVKIELEKVNN